MSAAAPPETVNNKCLCWNVSPHSLFLSWCGARVTALAAGVNAVLMITLLLLQGSLGSPGPPGRDGAKGEAVSLFILPRNPAFLRKAGSGNQSALSGTRLGDLCGHFRSSRNKWQEVNSPKTLPHVFAAKAGVLWINHGWRLQGSSVIIH